MWRWLQRSPVSSPLVAWRLGNASARRRPVLGPSSTEHRADVSQESSDWRMGDLSRGNGPPATFPVMTVLGALTLGASILLSSRSPSLKSKRADPTGASAGAMSQSIASSNEAPFDDGVCCGRGWLEAVVVRWMGAAHPLTCVQCGHRGWRWLFQSAGMTAGTSFNALGFRPGLGREEMKPSKRYESDRSPSCRSPK
jgi:hypothetical protein